MKILFEETGLALNQEQIDNSVKEVLEAIKNELPEEAHCIIGTCPSWARKACETINHPLCGCATDVIQKNHHSIV